jgi:hypothetical protein
MHLGRSGVLVASCIPLVAAFAKYGGPDYNSLPLDTIFPGPWESNIKAPKNKSHIVPVRIFNFEGATSGAEVVLEGADVNVDGGLTWGISPGGLITFEFAENIGGKSVFYMIDAMSRLIKNPGSVSKSKM